MKFVVDRNEDSTIRTLHVEREPDERERWEAIDMAFRTRILLAALDAVNGAYAEGVEAGRDMEYS